MTNLDTTSLGNGRMRQPPRLKKNGAALLEPAAKNSSASFTRWTLPGRFGGEDEDDYGTSSLTSSRACSHLTKIASVTLPGLALAAVAVFAFWPPHSGRYNRDHQNRRVNAPTLPKLDPLAVAKAAPEQGSQYTTKPIAAECGWQYNHQAHRSRAQLEAAKKPNNSFEPALHNNLPGSIAI